RRASPSHNAAPHGAGDDAGAGLRARHAGRKPPTGAALRRLHAAAGAAGLRRPDRPRGRTVHAIASDGAVATLERFYPASWTGRPPQMPAGDFYVWKLFLSRRGHE